MEQIVLVSNFQASMYSFKYVNIKAIAYNIFLSFLFNLRTRIFFSFLDAKTGKKKKKANAYSIKSKYSSSAIQLYEIQS